MNEDDKKFMIDWFNTLKDQIGKVEEHQVKTCDELDTVDSKVTQFGADLKNHLDNVKRQESNKVQLEKSNREKQALTISVISTCTAIISVTVVIFVTSF